MVINFWKKAKGIVRDVFWFRMLAYATAVVLIVIHRLDLHLPFTIIDTGSVLAYFIIPPFLFYRAVSRGKHSPGLINDMSYDFFFGG
jgi:hypothetical protein